MRISTIHNNITNPLTDCKQGAYREEMSRAHRPRHDIKCTRIFQVTTKGRFQLLCRLDTE